MSLSIENSRFARSAILSAAVCGRVFPSRPKGAASWMGAAGAFALWSTTMLIAIERHPPPGTPIGGPCDRGSV